MDANFDPYLILGISASASTDDVHRAYRRLAATMHPDLNQTDVRATSRFQQVQRAYELLRDPEKRRAWDSGEQPTTGNSSFEQCPICHGSFQLSSEAGKHVFNCPHCNAQLAMPGTPHAQSPAPPPPPPPTATQTPFSVSRPSDFRLDKSKPPRRVPMWSFWTFLFLGFAAYRVIVGLNREAGNQRTEQPQRPAKAPQLPRSADRQKQQSEQPTFGFPVAKSFEVSGKWVCERQTYRGDSPDILVKMTLDMSRDGTFQLNKLFTDSAGGTKSEVLDGKWERYGNDVSLEHPVRLPDWIHEVKIEQQGLGGTAENPALHFKIAGHAWAFRKESERPRTKYNFGLPPLEPLEYIPNNIDSTGRLQAW